MNARNAGGVPWNSVLTDVFLRIVPWNVVFTDVFVFRVNQHRKHSK
jgi:hypothetical protein